MGCLSFTLSFTKPRNTRTCRALVVLGLSFLGLLLLAAPAEADRNPFGPRAGSNLSGTPNQYGQVSRRPYRRRQPLARRAPQKSSSKFDYRFEVAEGAEDSEAAALASFQNEDVQAVGYCDGSEGCTCGNCIEAGCGCDDYCEPGCGCDDCCEPACGLSDSCEPACGCDDYCDPAYGCDDICCSSGGSCGGGGGIAWSAGFEWSFVKPRFSENVAFTTMTGDGNNNDTFTDTEFDYDLELTPRVWIEAAMSDCWSWRVSWWQFDHAPGALTTSPIANFGEITHPDFGDVDISTTLATETFSTSSRLNAYAIDLEAIKKARVSDWQLGVGGGVRYASAEQGYFAQLRDAGNDVIGQIDFQHQLEGYGPTMSLSGRRPLFRRVQLVGAARGSLLFGDGSSRLAASEDTTPSTTVRLRNREDLLPIGEARVGLEWISPKKRGSWQWMLSTAMEGQVWGNAGNAASETADLGFFGFNVGAGWLR